MAPARTCSECGGSLEGLGPRAISCSQSCRQKRARRRKHVNDDVDATAAEHAVRRIVNREAPDVLMRVMKQELAPVVREAINEDVVKAVGAMIGLTSQAVQVLQRDLEGDDRVLAQRAAALVVKYTVGHPALVKPEEEAHGQLVVNFNLPRPDDVDGELAEADEAGPDEAPRVCDICNTEKPAAEFAAGSERCNDCFRDFKERILESLHQ